MRTRHFSTIVVQKFLKPEIHIPCQTQLIEIESNFAAEVKVLFMVSIGNACGLAATLPMGRQFCWFNHLYNR